MSDGFKNMRMGIVVTRGVAMDRRVKTSTLGMFSSSTMEKMLNEERKRMQAQRMRRENSRLRKG